MKHHHSDIRAAIPETLPDNGSLLTDAVGEMIEAGLLTDAVGEMIEAAHARALAERRVERTAVRMLDDLAAGRCRCRWDSTTCGLCRLSRVDLVMPAYDLPAAALRMAGEGRLDLADGCFDPRVHDFALREIDRGAAAAAAAGLTFGALP